MAKTSSFFERIYTGEGGIDFAGRRRTWYSITAVVLIICIATIAIRGFSLSIDFQGGTKISMPAGQATTSEVTEVFEDATGVDPARVMIVGSGDARNVEINSPHLNEDQIFKARSALFETFKPKDASGTATPDSIGDSTVSNSWGSTITERMLLALVVFLVLIFAYITFRFERDMAITAIAALAVDGIVVAGIYSLVGFEVSPATVIGLLTVLSYSLYDTVVVFDKVKENTNGLFNSLTSTYTERANLAINQTVMRSINTTVFSVIPIASLMVITVWLLGVGTLKDLALVQFIGVIEGTFSSIFLATPLLITLKMLQKKYKKHTAEVIDARENPEKLAAEQSASAEFGENTSSSDDTLAPTKRVADLQPRQGEAATWRPGQN